MQRATARGENPAAEESAFDPVLEEDFSETFSDGTPSLGHFSLETVHALAGQEWYRRMGRTSAPDPVTRALIASLVVYALKPESPVRRRAAEWNLDRLRKNLGANASAAGSACDRELCELSCALWHVLLTAGIPIERAVDLREAIDGILLEGVDRTAVTAFSPALGPLISSPVKSG